MHPFCFTLPDILAELTETIKIKMPAVKQQLLILMTSLFKLTPKSYLTIKRIQPLFTQIVMVVCSIVCHTVNILQLMEDSDETVRECSYETFATVLAIVGERTLQGFTAQLDNVRKKKIQEKIPKDLPPAPAFPAPMNDQPQQTQAHAQARNPKPKAKVLTTTTTNAPRTQPQAPKATTALSATAAAKPALDTKPKEEPRRRSNEG